MRTFSYPSAWISKWGICPATVPLHRHRPSPKGPYWVVGDPALFSAGSHIQRVPRPAPAWAKVEAGDANEERGPAGLRRGREARASDPSRRRALGAPTRALRPVGPVLLC